MSPPPSRTPLPPSSVSEPPTASVPPFTDAAAAPPPGPGTGPSAAGGSITDSVGGGALWLPPPAERLLGFLSSCLRVATNAAVSDSSSTWSPRSTRCHAASKIRLTSAMGKPANSPHLARTSPSILGQVSRIVADSCSSRLSSRILSTINVRTCVMVYLLGSLVLGSSRASLISPRSFSTASLRSGNAIWTTCSTVCDAP